MKRAWIILCAACLLQACGVVNSLKMRYANDDLKPDWRASEASAEQKAAFIGVKPYIDVKLNGQGPFRFLLDTGASFSVLHGTPKVKALGLPKGFELAVGGWGDEKDSVAYQTRVNSLELEGVSFSRVSFAMLDVEQSLYYSRPDEVLYDGVIGHDVMKHFSWSMNWQRQRIAISRHSHSPQPEEVAIPFEVSFSKLELDIGIAFNQAESVSHPVWLDTGSRHYLKINRAYLDNRDIAPPGTQVSAVDFGLSGRAGHQRVTLPQVSLGDIQLTKVKTNLIEEGDEEDFWVIGSALLQHFEVRVDYPSDTLFLTPLTPFVSRYNLLGLELRKLQGGDFVVRYVFPELVAAHSGIEEGDVITQINGLAASEISQADWLALSATPGEYKVCLERGPCVALRSVHIPGYSL